MVKRLSNTNQNSQTLTNVPTPTNSGDAANKSYVDSNKGAAGPVSSTNNSLAIFDGTDGQKLKSSYITFDSSTNTLSSFNIGTGYFTITGGSTFASIKIAGWVFDGNEGTLYYEDNPGKIDISGGSIVNLNIINPPTDDYDAVNKKYVDDKTTTRIGTTTSSSAPTPDADSDDQYNVTALATGATFGAPTGTPTDGQKLVIRVKDNGTAQTLAYNSIYRAIGMTLPTVTVASKTLYLGLIYNAADTKWDIVAVTREA